MRSIHRRRRASAWAARTGLGLAASVLMIGPPGAACAAGQPDHSAWDSLLHKHVSGGEVAYSAWHADAGDRKALAGYLRANEGADPKSIASRDGRMAFWINAYNACVVDRVLERHPLRSVMDMKGFFLAKQCTVAGAKRSLDGIEKGILREKPFADPRLHFALNCASKSCPPLLGRAWTGKGIDKRLHAVTKAFITSGGGARVEGGTLHVSKLFQWYADDFKTVAPTTTAYVGRYLPEARDPALSLAYDEYDWSLNGR
jgi:hypothetical protein